MPVGLIVAVAGLVLVSACGGPRDRQRADGPAPTASTAPPPTTTAAARACLREDEAAAVFRFPTSDGASLAGVMLGRGQTGLVLGHQLARGSRVARAAGANRQLARPSAPCSLEMTNRLDAACDLLFGLPIRQRSAADRGYAEGVRPGLTATLANW